MLKELLPKIYPGRRRQRVLPSPYFSSDVFLVSFPKSGNTWVRFLIANAFVQHFQIPLTINWFNIQAIIPDIHASQHLSRESPLGISALPRTIKSHARYQPAYNRVLLIIRDPRDIMVSYYYYLLNRGRLTSKQDLSSLVRHPSFGVRAWKDHTQSWLEGREGQVIKFFTYEDLIKDTEGTLEKMCFLYGLEMSEENLEGAVRESSSEVMAEIEQLSRPDVAMKGQSDKFVRKATSEQGAELSREDREYIYHVAGDIMDEFGYKEGSNG